MIRKVFVYLCGPKRLQIEVVTPSDGLSLKWDITSSPRTVLLDFYTPDGVGADYREREGKVGKKQERTLAQSPTPGDH